jgi:general stress protein 26
MLTEEMKALIRAFSAGSVATINADGTPSVSPKATFVIVDDETLAFGNLRSPGTLANLRANPAVEVCFTDVLSRKAIRATGKASIVGKSEAPQRLRDSFNEAWEDYVPHMPEFVVIKLSAAELILSPAYDFGFSEAGLRAANLKRLNAL